MSSALSRSFERRDPRRRGRHHRRARGMRADAELDAVGLAVGHTHARDSRRRASRRRPAPSRSRNPGRSRRRRSCTSTAPEVSTAIRTPSDGPSPLFSTNMAMPAPTSSPAARRRAQVGLQRRPRTPRRAPFRAGPCSRRCRSGFPRRALRADARYGISAAVMALRRRTSMGSMPSFAAIASIRRSRTNVRLVAARRAIGRGRRLVGEAEMADRAIGRHPVRARAACRRSSSARGWRGCAHRRPGRARTRRRSRGCGPRRRPRRGSCGAAGANDWRRRGARGGPRSISPARPSRIAATQTSTSSG